MAEAAESFVSALKLQPGNPRWQYQAGVVFAAMKQTPQAIEHLEKALELDGDLADAAGRISRPAKRSPVAVIGSPAGRSLLPR